MAKVLTALTRSIGRPYYVTVSLRCLKTSSVNMDKALENLKTNPYYEKYAARIADLQKTSPEEFMQRVELQQQSKEEEKKKKFASVDTRWGPFGCSGLVMRYKLLLACAWNFILKLTFIIFQTIFFCAES